VSKARPNYIAVDGKFKPSIIRLCSDEKCDRYHEWVTLSEGDRWDAEIIVAALNNE
jgi:hypothetical protein